MRPMSPTTPQLLRSPRFALAAVLALVPLVLAPAQLAVAVRVLIFAILDGLAKYVMQTLPAPVAVFFRYLIALVLAMLLIFVVPFLVWRVGKTDYFAPLAIVQPEDYTLVALRTAVIPRDTPHAAEARRFLDYLLSPLRKVSAEAARER